MTQHFICEICGWKIYGNIDRDYFAALHEKTYLHQRALLSRAVEQFNNAFCKQFRDILDRWVKR